MDYNQLLEKVEEIVEPVLNHLGLELVEREFAQDYGRWILRIYIDREVGEVIVQDCADASRAIEGVLDVEDLIPHRYSLEVSSPGENRPIRKKGDFERFAGSAIDLKTKEMTQGRHHFSGLLQGMRGEDIIINEGDQEWQIPWALLKKARIKRRGSL